MPPSPRGLDLKLPDLGEGLGRSRRGPGANLESPWNALANAAYCTLPDNYYYPYDLDYDDHLDVPCDGRRCKAARSR